MRDQIYVKDEDYRFSFLYGNYITLTSLGKRGIKRIIEQGMSPLYDELRFLHRLCRLVIEGGFVPNLGIKVLDERLERAQERLKHQKHQAACHAAAKRRAANPDHDPLAEIKKTLGTARNAKKDESAC